MSIFANISIREIDNGFVVSTGGHANLGGGPSTSERFYPDFETLTSDARAIFEAALNQARAYQADQANAIANQRAYAESRGAMLGGDPRYS